MFTTALLCFYAGECTQPSCHRKLTFRCGTAHRLVTIDPSLCCSANHCHCNNRTSLVITRMYCNQEYHPVTDIVCIKIEAPVADRYTTINLGRPHSDYLQ